MREVKLSVIIFYYIIVGVMGLITITYLEVKAKPNRESLVELFICESTGNKDCSHLNLGNLDTLNALAVVVISMIAMLPVAVLLFSCDRKCGRR